MLLTLLARYPQHPPRAHPARVPHPAVIDILVDKFALKPIGDPAEDLADAMAGA